MFCAAHGTLVKPAGGAVSHHVPHRRPVDGIVPFGYVVCMRLRLRYFAAARDAAGLADEDVDLPTTTRSVAAVRAALLAHRPGLARVLAQSRLAVDQRFARDDDDVPEGAEVAVIPPVAGG